MRSVAALLVGLAVALAGAGRVRADRPTSPPRLIEGCRREPGSSLCREVRRLCAVKTVRDDVVPVCKELGWYGDSVYREIVNLCPIDPGHADCLAVKAKCEQKQAEKIGDDGVKLCREMGWGEYAYARLEAPAAELPEAAEVPRVTERPAVAATVAVPAEAPRRGFDRWAAGIECVGLRVGFVDEPLLIGDHERLYSAHLAGTGVSFERVPFAYVVSADLGHAAGGGTLYRLDGLVGVGRWLTPHLAGALVAGVGVSGLSGSVGAATDLPVRFVGVVHAGDSLTLEGWAQLEWYAMAEDDTRGSGSPSVDFADAAELGAGVLFGSRPPANVRQGFFPGFWLGGLYQEQNGTRILSIMIGWGGAKEPWNLR